MAKKATKAEVSQRVKEVSDLLLAGHTRSSIMQYAASWNLQERQIDEYIAQATSQIKEINQISIQDNMALIVSNYWDLYRRAAQAGDLSEQHRILNSIAKVKGLDQLTINHIVEDKRELEHLSDEDLDKALEEAAAANAKH